MNGLRNTKYMDYFTVFGYIGAFLVGIIVFVTRKSILLIPSVLLIFVLRVIGYGIDRILERHENR